MKDAYNREINYMRVSVTDRCDLRCVYCMPAEGVEKRGHDDILRSEELLEIVASAARLGISKIRVTGGEPLVRRGIAGLCREIAKTPGVRELAVTTNAQLLAPLAGELKSAGVSRLNISIDTLDADKFKQITRTGELQKTLDGIQAARDAGFEKLKLNVVLVAGFNDDEIKSFVEMTRNYDVEVRFIELMPIGEGIPLWRDSYLSNEEVLCAVPELRAEEGFDGVARLYRLPGAVGRVGLINPVSNHFCGDCNKIRLTADGKIKPCLHSGMEYDIRGKRGDDLERALADAILTKPERHNAYSEASPSDAGRGMNRIGG